MNRRGWLTGLHFFFRAVLASLCVLCGSVVHSSSCFANRPVGSYVYPPGGQRGTAVKVRVGGLFLHDKCGFSLSGTGGTPSPGLTRTAPPGFEGPMPRRPR